MTRTLFVALLILSAAAAPATTLTSPSLEQVVTGATVVARIQVIEGNAYRYEHEGRQDTCGIKYQAEVLDAVKGKVDQQIVRFSSNSSLAVGGEYLVFLKPYQEDTPPDAELIKRWDYVESENYQQCRAQLREVDWAGGFAFRFYEPMRDEDGQKVWLLKDHLLPSLPEGIETIKMRCGSEEESGCEVVSEPVLISWPSLKCFLKEVVEDSAAK